MDVGINEAGKECRIAEIDDLCAGRDGAADRLDTVVFHDDHRVGDDVVGGAVEEPRRLEDHDVGRLGHRAFGLGEERDA